MAIKFRELAIGQTFDFIDDENPTWNSFYLRCRKISPRGYTYEQRGETVKARVGSINVAVYHVNDVPNIDA